MSYARKITVFTVLLFNFLIVYNLLFTLYVNLKIYMLDCARKEVLRN